MRFDLIIVGGGPAGLYAGFYAGLRDLSTHLIEADLELGGRLRYYPDKTVWDVGGLPPVRGSVLRNHLEAQARTFSPTVTLGHRITAASYRDGEWSLTDNHGQSYRSRAVLWTVGYGTLETRRLVVPGVETRHDCLRYSLESVEEFRERRVVVSGGGDSAVDWAHQLVGVAASITVVHRRHQFRAHERMAKSLEDHGVEVLTPWTIEKLSGAALSPVVVSLVHAETRLRREVTADLVLVGHGLDFKLAENPGHRYPGPGAFFAGDCVQREGKVHLIASTFPEAAEAVNRAKSFLDPGAESQAMVSSHNTKFEPFVTGIKENV